MAGVAAGAAGETRTPPAPTVVDRETYGALERTLWLAAYVVAVLAPLALMLVAGKPGDRSFGVVLGAGLGFAGLTMLVLQMVMPSRARVFTAPFGIDLLLRFHRQIGAVALGLVVAHVAVLVIDDPVRLALLNPLDAPGRARAGLAALVALALLVASSTWRRALGLRYEPWRALHVVLGALVIAASFAHAIGVSQYLATGTIRWAVLALVVVAAGALFYLRVGRPFAAAGRPYRVVEVRPERGGATTLELESAAGAAPAMFEAGQFAWLKLARAPYSLSEHPFSYSSSASRPERPEFTIKAVGDFTEGVRLIAPGTDVLLDGPHGSLRPADPRASYVLIAAGVGITPIVSILRTMADEGDDRPLLLVYGSRSWEEITFRERLEELERRLTLSVVHVLSEPSSNWEGERGRIDARLLAAVLPPATRDWNHFVCGPPAMVDSVERSLEQLGIDRERVHAERFISA